MTAGFARPDALRAAFSRALSAMYRDEVPGYGALLGIVSEAADPGAPDAARLGEERHGAIRLGTGGELALMRRLFALFGMAPVGHYDLAVAGIPVQSTAFRPVDAAGLRASPFRMFTSLLRLDLIEDPGVRNEARAILSRRRVGGDALRAALERAERDGGVEAGSAPLLVAEAAALFRWNPEAVVDADTYRRLAAAHPVVADVVGFAGPHLNHLTPRTRDIDAAHAAMAARGLEPKPEIEGPPARRAPILLRQTSFRARAERVRHGGREWSHTARFGEIESRGAALTPAGRALYDRCLAEGGGRAFEAIPDDLDRLAEDGLAFVAEGAHGPVPVTYEDFLPVSAAGIFRSNLGDAPGCGDAASDRPAFEAAMGAAILDPFALYAAEAARDRRAEPPPG